MSQIPKNRIAVPSQKYFCYVIITIHHVPLSLKGLTMQTLGLEDQNKNFTLCLIVSNFK